MCENCSNINRIIYSDNGGIDWSVGESAMHTRDAYGVPIYLNEVQVSLCFCIRHWTNCLNSDKEYCHRPKCTVKNCNKNPDFFHIDVTLDRNPGVFMLMWHRNPGVFILMWHCWQDCWYLHANTKWLFTHHILYAVLYFKVMSRKQVHQGCDISWKQLNAKTDEVNSFNLLLSVRLFLPLSKCCC